MHYQNIIIIKKNLMSTNVNVYFIISNRDCFEVKKSMQLSGMFSIHSLNQL